MPNVVRAYMIGRGKVYGVRPFHGKCVRLLTQYCHKRMYDPVRLCIQDTHSVHDVQYTSFNIHNTVHVYRVS